MFHEYPKCLYLAGQMLLVDDKAQEEAARADGYDDWHADHARTNDTDPAEPEELDRDALKARAAALGLSFARNISNEKLADMIAADQ